MKAVEYISIVALLGLLAFKINFAQNHKAAHIDASGKVTDADGSTIALINSHGVIVDNKGLVLGKLDGSVLKNQDGEIMGETLKNGYFKDYSGQILYTIQETDNMNRFKMMDNKGNVVGLVDKAQLKTASCLVHSIIKREEYEPKAGNLIEGTITSNYRP